MPALRRSGASRARNADDRGAQETISSLMTKAKKFADIASSPPISHPAQTRSSLKVHPFVEELLERRKSMLNRLWEETDTSWVHREAFSYSNFRSQAQEHFADISHETMRMFEVTWLDSRIRGLIDQREDCMDQMRAISESHAADGRAMHALLMDQLLIFRSTTLYITEYILAWKSKMTEKQAYSWGNEEDYMKKMSVDFQTLTANDSNLLQALNDMDIDTRSPLLPPLYMDRLLDDSDLLSSRRRTSAAADRHCRRRTASFGYVEKIAAPYAGCKSEEHPNTDSARHSDSRARGTAASDIPVFITEERLHNRATMLQQYKTALVSSKGRHVGLVSVDDMLQTSDSEALSAASNIVVVGGHTQQATDPGRNTKNGSRIVDSTRTKSATEADMDCDSSNPESRAKHILANTVQKPRILVEQLYSDRNRRFRKYTFPLVSVRHEDLLEQNMLDPRWDLKVARENSSKRCAPMQAPSIATSSADINLKFSNQVLARNTKRPDKTASLRRSRIPWRELSQRAKSPQGTTRRSERCRNTNVAELDMHGNVVFPQPDFRQEIARIRRAEAVITGHL